MNFYGEMYKGLDRHILERVHDIRFISALQTGVNNFVA